MHRDGELSATDYAEIVLNALGNESEASVISAQLANLETSVEIYSSPKNRENLRARRSSGLYKLATLAKPGSDEQLALVKGFAAGATSADSPKIKPTPTATASAKASPTPTASVTTTEPATTFSSGTGVEVKLTATRSEEHTSELQSH